jgi:hypothetical protein
MCPAWQAVSQGSTIWLTSSTSSSPTAAISSSATPVPAGREEVRANLERCWQKDFVEKYCGDDVERGLKVLYEDPS